MNLFIRLFITHLFSILFMPTSSKQMLLATFFVCYALSSHAELGGTVAPQAKKIREQSSVVVAQPTLNVFENTLATGTVVREYTNSAGVVVAVAWNGPGMPDLQDLLGQHFDAFANRPASANSSHRHAILNTEDLVVESHGQMRAFYGRAYLPKLLPVGASLEQIK